MSNGGHLQEQDQATFLNVVYSYFVSHPSELRHDVRENFEQYISGITEETGTDAADDRPIDQQAAGMMDQLALMEQMMGTSTFTDVIERHSDSPPEEWTREQEGNPPPPPAFPTYRLD